MYKRTNRRGAEGAFPAITAALVVAGALYAPRAHAYLDAGTGSLILQVVAGVFLGIFLTFKLWWYKLVGALRKLFGARQLDTE